MKKVKILFQDILKVRIDRPEGYLEDILRHGNIHGEYVIFSFNDYCMLRDKYSPMNIKEGQKESYQIQPPEVWGPRLWKKLHERAKLYNGIEDREWFDAFRVQIPCVKCIIEMDKYLKKNPVSFREYSRWSIEFHNHVNNLLGKPIWKG